MTTATSKYLDGWAWWDESQRTSFLGKLFLVLGTASTKAIFLYPRACNMWGLSDSWYALKAPFFLCYLKVFGFFFLVLQQSPLVWPQLYYGPFWTQISFSKISALFFLHRFFTINIFTIHQAKSSQQYPCLGLNTGLPWNISYWIS